MLQRLRKILPARRTPAITSQRIIRDGRQFWRYSDGTELPVIAGGAPDDGGGDGDGDADGDGDDGDDNSGDDDTSDDGDDGDDTGDGDGKDDDKPLGPAGEKALAAEKTKRRREADRRRKAEKELTDVKTRLAKLEKGDDDKTPNADQIREQARQEAKAEALKDRVLDRIEARAGKKFADPEDARLGLAKRADDFIDGDEVDVDAIDEALNELLEAKPHLAAGKRRFKGDADQGARKTKKDQPKTFEDAVLGAMSGTKS